MYSYRRASLSFLLMALMVLTAFAMLPTQIAAQTSDVVSAPDGETVTSTDGSETVDRSALLTPEMKIDSVTKTKMMTASGKLSVYVFVTDKEAVNEYLASAGMPLITKKEFAGLPVEQLMQLDSKQIYKLAELPSVSMIKIYEKPVVEQTSVDVAPDGPVDPIPAVEDYDVDEVHGAVAAWADGWTGDGVKVAVIDDGFDMAHPDLMGQQARYTSGPYAGWPIAYDDYAANLWGYEEIGSWVADTSTEVPEYGSYVYFDGARYMVDGLTDVGGAPVDSVSGWYHIGYHPDANLVAYWEGPVAVLVVDANSYGWYDTVYVDLDHDFDFTDEKACTMGDEASYYDFYDSVTEAKDWSAWNAGDGYADLSGGMIYWISDGSYWYPAANWTYGTTWAPSSGSAVAFMGAFTEGASHGTMTASAALGTGESMLLLRGMAYEADLICIPFTGDTINAWMFAEFGADGLANTEDDANVVSNSYGWSETAVDAGYEDYDDVATSISLSGYETLWVWSAGNGGPGYGTTHTVTDFTSVHVGAGTTMMYRAELGMENDLAYSQWGDVIPFSNSGPTRTGKLNAEIIASGAYSMEPAPLNMLDYYEVIGDGSMHFQLGSGTSHAAPTVAGGAALGYQAYYDSWGSWPAMDWAKAVLMGTADDMHFDPLKQGSGWLNAKAYTDAMSEADGVYSYAPGGMYEPMFTKAASYPGSIYGTRMETFVNLIYAGDYDANNLFVTLNWDQVNTRDVNITSQILLKQDSDAIDVTTTGSDIFMDIASYVPVTTDLLKVTMYWDYSIFDVEQDYVTDASYRLELHDWVDENGDGEINTSWLNDWELYRFSVDGEDNNYNQIEIKNPRDRITDGLVVRIIDSTEIEGYTLHLQLDYYELETFPWISFTTYMSGDPWSTGLDYALAPIAPDVAVWMYNLSVPADAPVGTYAAGIYVDDGVRVQCIPVVINVAARDYQFEFGGASYFDTPYNNDVTGLADKGWRFESGDWRIYWSLPEDWTNFPDIYSDLIVKVNWTELPTDTNVHVLAPLPSFILPWDYTFEPPLGPGLTEVRVASSDEKYLGGGTFGVYTSTGGPSEVIAVPNSNTEWGADGFSVPLCEFYSMMYTGTPGPFAIVTRTPVMSGTTPSDTIEGYTRWVTVSDYSPYEVWFESVQPGDPLSPGYVPLADTIPAEYSIDVDGTIEVKGGGVAPVAGMEWPAEAIYQDALSGTFVEALANADYTRVMTVGDTSELRVATEAVSDVTDLDLGIFYDENMDGQAQTTEPYWYSAGATATEAVDLELPEAGQYVVKVLGYTVPGTPGYFSLTVQMTIMGATIEAVDIDGTVGAGTYGFNLSYSLPAIAGIYAGEATFGFMGASDMFSIPVTIDVIDEGAPAIENLVPADGTALASNLAVVEFDVNDNVAFYSGLDEGSLLVEIDGIDWTEFATVIGDHVTLVPPFTLAEGAHTVYVEAADMYGNWAEPAMSTFTVNSVFEEFSAEFMDPVLPVMYADGATVSLDSILVQGMADPASAIEISSPTASASTDADDAGAFSAELALAEGVNVFTVVATNDAGVSATMYKTIIADTVCVLTVDQVVSPTADATVTLTGMAEMGATVTVNGSAAAVSADGSWSFEADLYEGDNTLAVEAVDAVGNSASVDVAVALDTTAPALAITSPAAGTTVSEPSVTVEGTVNAGAMVYVDGVLAGDGVTAWSAVVVLSEGDNTVTVTATDDLGNSVTLTRTVTYEPPVYATPDDLSDLQDQLDGLNETTQQDVTDLQDQIDQDVGDVNTRVDDADAFAKLLLYMNLGLFAVALILIVVVWYVLKGRSGGNPGTGHSMEQVDDPPEPSDVEKEFEKLEKEVRKD